MHSKNVLLIIDDTPNVVRALARVLGKRFDEVRTAANAGEGEIVLAQAGVTHLICDQNLGEGDPAGLELVPRWRAEHPSIKRAIILTGLHERSLTAVPGVDAVVSKLTESTELLRLLEIV